MEKASNIQELLLELEETRRQLQEAQDTIEAIRTGQVDALVVQKGDEHQLYTLQTADHAYRIFIEKMNEGAVTLNREGIILYANSQFAEMVSQPLTQVIGLPFLRFVASHAKVLYTQLFEGCWKEDCKGELDICHGDSFIPVQLSLNILELAEGASMSIILTDLTLQKATQKQLEENNRQLALLNRSLEASNHDLQQFASVASHDLQEPLRKIQIFGNMLQSTASMLPDSKQQLYLHKMMGAAGRMKTLIVDVLNYSQLSVSEGGFVQVDLNELVADLLEDLELVIEEKKAQIKVTGLPVLAANRGQLRQMFQNLLSNALKFSEPGRSPVISISAVAVAEKRFDSPLQPNGSYYLIVVADNGIGFDEKFIPNIFALFERLNAKDKFEGTGIGLAITKKIVEKHEGIIHVRSKPGQGSEFHIILPAQHEVL